jgi:SAM-dependent methyltransferase
MHDQSSQNMGRTIQSDDNGNEFEMREIDCPTCGPRFKKAFVGIRGGSSHRFGKGTECRIVRCEKCGLYFPNPFPFPIDAQRLYGDPEKYFVSHDMERKISSFRQLIRGFIKSIGSIDISILDVGSGRGELLAAAKAEGISRVVGLELSSSMIEYAKVNFGVEVIGEVIEDFSEHTTEKFDVIVLNAVLEHVYNPDSMIAACAQLLSPCGILYIDIPNEEHLLARVGGLINRIRNRTDIFILSPTFSPYHVFGFSERSLGVLLAKYGFNIQRIRVHAKVKSRSTGGVKGRVISVAELSLHFIANLIGMASNMYVWARFTNPPES